MMRRIISVLMENEAGALSRVVGLFAQRNYNIETLTVAPTEDATKQLNKLIDVVKLGDLTDGDHVERELMLIKIKATGAQREETKRMADIFRGQIVDVTHNAYTIQLAGTSEKLDAFVRAMADSVVLEVVRTGVSGVSRGEKVLTV